MQVKKSQKASLENKQLIYVLMGFVFVLSVCYVAFEWTEQEVTKYEVTDTDFLFEEEVEIQQTSQQENTPPPPPPAAQEVEVLNVVEDDVETEAIEINTEDDKNTEVVIAAPVEAPVEEEEEESVVFVVVETMPEFPGGQQALFKYLSENVKYPVIAQENGIQGRVICQFVVNKDGAIVDVEVVRSGGDPSLDKEAVRVKYTVPVNFRLQ